MLHRQYQYTENAIVLKSVLQMHAVLLFSLFAVDIFACQILYLRSLII